MPMPVIRNNNRRAIISMIRLQKLIRIRFNLAADAHAKLMHHRVFYAHSKNAIYYHKKNIGGYNHKSKNFVPGLAPQSSEEKRCTAILTAPLYGVLPTNNWAITRIIHNQARPAGLRRGRNNGRSRAAA